jgi:hypothetical protein
MRVFSVKMGQKLDPTIGLNEFASAVMAARMLTQEQAIPLSVVADICAVIEATIPFRDNQWTERLRSNLLEVSKEFKMNRTGKEVDQGVCEAVNLANRDVGDFGEAEELLFVDGTWDLLVENNPRLRLEGNKCPLNVWRCGLQKTHTFLCTVATNLIFSKFRETPSLEYVDWLSSNAVRNVEVGRLYSGVKYVTLLLLEAIETLTDRVAKPMATKPFVPSEENSKDRKDAAPNGHIFGNHAPTKNNKNNKSSLEKEVSIKNVTRAFKLHRTIKDNRIDQNLSHLGQQLIHSLDGDLEKINQFLSGVKSKLTSGREPMSKEEALAISQQFSLSYMRAVQQAFSLSVDGF